MRQLAQLGRNLVRWGLLFGLAAGLFGCDHATKAVATSALANGTTVPLVGDVVVLRYVPNTDVAFSMFHNIGGTSVSPGVLAALAIGAIALLAFVWWRSRRDGPLVNVGFAAAFAGALGNVVDRLTHGYVVDFIHVKRWPVFNVADILVVAGIALAFLAKGRKRARLQEE
jgi:signal peptidase II